MKTFGGLKDCLFAANDPDKHDICWGPAAEVWLFEGKEDLIDVFDTFQEAYDRLREVSGENKITIHPNPY